ncbi:CDP-diacylglycerol diphosphatase [Rhizobium sp. S163]|uniref:CDP-diacylglycerol diphosphatase n=1 Tax=Rhizobium sp. S163 TaxID=3055039 RepID=UPI000DDBA0A9
MMRMASTRRISIALGATVVASIAWFTLRSNPNALWSIIQDRCLIDVGRRDGLPPCVRVERQEGYVVIKDRKGSHHFLLLPTEKMTGIEDPRLLDAQSPNYFDRAWGNRELLSGERDVSDEQILLAVNSEYGRSQNQLHIHISCTRPDVRQKLLELETGITDTWEPLSVEFSGHAYWARRVTMPQFAEVGPFRLLAYGLPRSVSSMGRYSVAMTELKGEVILLATERNLYDLNFASSEELQDHECAPSAG